MAVIGPAAVTFAKFSQFAKMNPATLLPAVPKIVALSLAKFDMSTVVSFSMLLKAPTLLRATVKFNFMSAMFGNISSPAAALAE